MGKYIVSIDQSTQGTKALIFDAQGVLIFREDIPHQQIVNEKGWVSHCPEEIYENTIRAVRNAVVKSNIPKKDVMGIGISNQRETSVAWNRVTQKSIANAIVWQCSRAKELCSIVERSGKSARIREVTGIPLSPYFPASKYAWFLKEVEGAREDALKGQLCLGTMDSWLIFRLTGGRVFKTDYSNASRTQLFNLHTLSWDTEICELFGIPRNCLAEICDSDACFGETDVEGFFEQPIKIHSALGDSHAALFGQGCLKKGMIKTTYGTGSSIMMNVGEEPIFSENGLVSSLAWGLQGTVQYVLEGNINYTGAVIRWLEHDLQMVTSAKEAECLAKQANPSDTTYLVPAFTGLGAPYWDSEAKAVISGITRTTGKAELVKAALDCIAYQITDVTQAMCRDSGIAIQEIRVDGGPTRNQYLMQFQSDIANLPVQVPAAEELSGIGAAYAAGLALGLYDEHIFDCMERKRFEPYMDEAKRCERYQGWLAAVGLSLTRK